MMFTIRNLILVILICLYVYGGALLFRFLEVENTRNSCVIVRPPHCLAVEYEYEYIESFQ